MSEEHKENNTVNEGAPNQNKNLSMFLSSLAQYFKDFLETDFHNKTKLPKRNIQFRAPKTNLITGIKLNKYEKFNSLIWKNAQTSFVKESLSIKKKAYVTKLPKHLSSLIDNHTHNIEQSTLDTIISEIAFSIDYNTKKYIKESDIALDQTLDTVKLLLKKHLVTPFLQSIESHLENKASANIESLYLLEEDLSSIFLDLIDNKVCEIINLLLANTPVNNIEAQLSTVLGLTETVTIIKRFFDNFAAKDLFTELYELFNNERLLDKQQIYLYLCDIKFENTTYPLFYIPVELLREPSGYSLQFDSVLYVNKKVIDYIVQQYNRAHSKVGTLKSTIDRIIYLKPETKEHLLGTLDGILKEVCDYFELKNYLHIESPHSQTTDSLFVTISNTCYLSLFDKSDEALINDYEQIEESLQSNDSDLIDSFTTLIDSFIHKEPKSVVLDVEQNWEQTPITERLISNHPIPLNAEQRQILQALEKKECKYITVEGPPGTGKSHTITAVLFNTILQGKSVLVLSDKKEALDVVEDKISETINKVRLDKNFQNPILRLGKAGNSYNKILASSSIKDIKIYHKAYQTESKNPDNNEETLLNSAKEGLADLISAHNDIKIKDLEAYHNAESKIKNTPELQIDLSELYDKNNSSLDLRKTRDALAAVDTYCQTYKTLLKLFTHLYQKKPTINDFLNFTSLLEIINTSVEKHPNIQQYLELFSEFNETHFTDLEDFINQALDIKSQWLSVIFQHKKIKILNNDLRKALKFRTFTVPYKKLTELQDIFYFFTDLNEQIAHKKMTDGFAFPSDPLKFAHHWSTTQTVAIKNSDILMLRSNLLSITNFIKHYPNISLSFELNLALFDSLFKNKLTFLSTEKFDTLIQFIDLKLKLGNAFSTLPKYDYLTHKNILEARSTARMTNVLDHRVITFYENNKNTVKSLKDVIKNKQPFPKKDFKKLKEAFPCILSGIRDFAEFIPLEANLFDLVIIDEASQVSIAQAFPALLRAKKVLVLGDMKQFSNIKSAHAGSETNKAYLNNLETVFRKHISEDVTKLSRLKKFNIKTSILEFCEHISNYHTMLLKHFRGYKELISYSNRYFYKDALQAIKVRGIPIEDVIKFTLIEHDGKIEPLNNTNSLEIDYIISLLLELSKEKKPTSVGIITPHTNQQKKLVDAISKLEGKDDLFTLLNLKIMTFDTCQGEERDIIIYSMVASPVEDSLRWIFIKDIDSVDVESDAQIKAQRLNVGFSRAKECMHFVCSKPLSDYTGSIGEALRYYQAQLTEAKQFPAPNDVDPKSPMEKKVLDWIQQTPFFKKNKQNIHLHAQFPLGKYLKQLTPFYHHPNYLVDFL
eukprot:COSAG01_NODE_3683_length_5800_cov_3.276267_4_plen_1334_part_01